MRRRGKIIADLRANGAVTQILAVFFFATFYGMHTRSGSLFCRTSDKRPPGPEKYVERETRIAHDFRFEKPGVGNRHGHIARLRGGGDLVG